MSTIKEEVEHTAAAVHSGTTHRQNVKIMINTTHYTTPKNPMTVAEIKGLAGLPLDYNCSKIEHGKTGPTLANELSLDLHPGDRFIINTGEDPS